MNPLLPPGRTTPVAAWITARDNSPFGNSNRTRSVSSTTTATGPANGAGVSGPRLGAPGPDAVTLQDLAHL